MSHLILDAQAQDRIHGFRIATGEQQNVRIGGFDVTICGAHDAFGLFGTGSGTAADSLAGYELILKTGPEDFTIAARHASVSSARADVVIEVDHLQEGEHRPDEWVPLRTLNGDERDFAFQSNDLRVVRYRLLLRSATSSPVS